MMAVQSLIAAPSDRPHAGPPNFIFGPTQPATATEGGIAVFEGSSALGQAQMLGLLEFISWPSNHAVGMALHSCHSS